MTGAPETLGWDATLDEAIALCRSRGVRHVPVLQGAHLVGVLSDRDLRRAHGAGRPPAKPVDEILTWDVRTIEPAAPLGAAARKLLEHGISSLPVTEDEILVGMLTVSDLLDPCLRALERA